MVPGNRRFRDRIDLILDVPIVERQVTKLGRMRLFVDPFEEHSPSELSCDQISADAHSLLNAIAEFYCEHRYQAELVWDHWTQDYIDYFGPRLQAVQKTRFPTLLDDAYAQSNLSQLAQGEEASRVRVGAA
jgi:hypothetical protein